jgi:hypothetical protein
MRDERASRRFAPSYGRGERARSSLRRELPYALQLGLRCELGLHHRHPRRRAHEDEDLAQFLLA